MASAQLPSSASDWREPAERPNARHWLEPAGRTWTPPVLAFLDTETTPLADGDREILTLRCWVASRVVRRQHNAKKPGVTTANGTTGPELADWLDAMTVGTETLWLYAHNLGFDLATTRLLTRLPALGWTLGSCSLSDQAPVIKMAKGRRRITMVDSWSWLPTSLSGIAPMTAHRKRSLPGDDAPADLWLARCTDDVLVLADAILTLMEWWEANDLGHWSTTGAGCGWSTLRRRIGETSLFVDPTPDRRAFERRAIYGGRRDCTAWGQLTEGPWIALDFEAAYPTLAKHLTVPAVPKELETAPPLVTLANPRTSEGWVAEVRLATDEARYPVRWGSDVILPVGTFWTTLAGPELAAAVLRGAVTEVGTAWRYRCMTSLSSWADWVLRVMGQVERTDPDVARFAAKTWGRSAIGKTAGHTSTVAARGPALVQGWSAVPGWDAAKAAPGVLADLAGQRWWIVKDQEAHDAMPAVFAWIESACRARLRAALDELGEDTWVQCDTDGILASAPAMRRWLKERGVRTAGLRSPVAVAATVCDQMVEITAPLVLRPKAMWHHVEVIGPQHMMLGSGQKLSGIRGDARQSGPRARDGRTWPRLNWQMRHGDRRGYVRPMGTWTIPVVNAHRWALDTGTLAPIETVARDDTTNEVLAWPATRWAGMGAKLAADQWSRLDGLRETPPGA